MRNRRNTFTQSRVETTRQAGTRSAGFFCFFFLNNKNANKETKSHFCVNLRCCLYQQSIISLNDKPTHGLTNLVSRASFPLTSGRKTRALGATISGMRHRCRCAVSRITRIRLFPLFFHNGCSQSSRFPTAGQGERSSGNEIAV